MEKKTIEQLEKELELLQAKNAELQNENNDLIEINKELTLELESQSALKETPIASGLVTADTFDFEDKQYGFAIPGVTLNGKVITIKDVMADEALQAKLVKIKSGMIAEIASA